MSRWRAPAIWLAALLAAASAPAQNTAQVEALQRLKGLDLEANPALKAAVLRVVESTRGTPQFVELVRDFKLADQQEGLLEAALKFPGESAGAEAARLLLAAGPTNALAEALRSAKPDDAARLAQALGNTGDKAAVPLLLPLLGEAHPDPAVRSAAVRALARTEDGAGELLRLARAGELDDRAKDTAALELANARWPAIKAEAASVLPPPTAGDGTPLPPLAELVKLTGDPVHGARVFRSERAACSKCHQVGDEGVGFGPALTEIGTKLGRQALYESILDPSAGISFGFEGWEVETRQGDELFGLIASETADELAIREQNGVVTRVKKSDIATRRMQSSSIMPAGLAQAMTQQELVDLIEYLTTLKKP